MMDNAVKVKLREGARLPVYSSEGAAGADLHALTGDFIPPGARRLIPTGVSIELPPGYEAQVRPRSGLALKSGITVLNTPGTIDEDYRGEIGLILINHSQDVFDIRPGDRLAQLVIAPVTRASFETAELSKTARGEGGFGSTGVKA